MTDSIQDLRNRVAAAIDDAIPGQQDHVYAEAADKVLDALDGGRCFHEWNVDRARDIYWCEHCGVPISGDLARSPDLISQATLDELADRPMTVRTKERP